MSIKNLIYSLMFSAAVVAVGCGESKLSMSPVAPSAVVTGALSDEAGAADTVSGPTGGPRNGGGKPDTPGNGNGNGKPDSPGNGGGSDHGDRRPPSVPTPSHPPTHTTPPAAGKVEIEGEISATGPNTITVKAQSITVPDTCVIRHGNTRYILADLRVGDRVHVKGLRMTTGSGTAAITTIVASEVKLQHPDDDDDEDEDDEP